MIDNNNNFNQCTYYILVLEVYLRERLWRFRVFCIRTNAVEKGEKINRIIYRCCTRLREDFKIIYVYINNWIVFPWLCCTRTNRSLRSFGTLHNGAAANPFLNFKSFFFSPNEYGINKKGDRDTNKTKRNKKSLGNSRFFSRFLFLLDVVNHSS